MTYEGITEAPGNGASAEQLSILRTRYDLARRQAAGKRVLEVACGTGIGLGYLAQAAASVVGVDIEPANVARATRTAERFPNVTVRQGNAEDLDFPDASFDVVLLFEALYYLPSPERFFTEARRVLAPGGVLVVSSVNCRWHGFNPSPFSRTYFDAAGLRSLAEGAGLTAELSVAFDDHPDRSRKALLLSLVKRAAVRLHLIPKTMKGKERLKRLVFGQLTPLPDVLTDDIAPLGALLPLDSIQDEAVYKSLYCVARPA